MEIDLNKIKKVHFIGVGGIGISAIARLMISLEKAVSGSDGSLSPITIELSKIGVNINLGQDVKNISPDVDLVVYTIAVKDDNPELVTARSLGIQTISYPEMLSVLSKNMCTIAVSGTHGKTTTTAMISKIFIDLNLDPTVIVGSILKDQKSNLIVGKSNYFIVEACEYRRSFLNLHPNVLVVTNIDLDHLDYYKDLADIQSAFRELAERVPIDGAVVCDKNDMRVAPVIKDLKCHILDYKKFLNEDFKLSVPGLHNRQNASASVAVADFFKLENIKVLRSLENFTGTWRRFDLKGQTSDGTKIYDDYAHHPKEITSTLSGMKEMYPNSTKVAIFQPHLYSRTKDLLNDFARSFDDVEKVYVLPIFGSREKIDPSINSEMLVDRINEGKSKAVYLESFDKALDMIKNLDKNTVLINIGAGDIYKLSELAVLL